MQMESSTKEEKMKMGVPRIMDCVGGSEDPSSGWDIWRVTKRKLCCSC
jgi:hypothetical protein